MMNVQDIRKWLTAKYGEWRKVNEVNEDAPYMERHALLSPIERSIGAIALWSLMLLIKIYHIKNGGSKYDHIMRMDGNADNWHELRDYKSPASEHSYQDMQHESIVKTAGILLKYGS
jgi:hypothetical protein